MAEFKPAYHRTAKSEGGWNHVAGDRGGETYKGIARKFWPEWPGWKLVDAAKPLKHNQVIKSSALDQLVMDFYKKNFWDPVQGDQLRFQDFANELYDMAVNSGTSTAIKTAQKAAGIAVTGKIDSLTLAKFNNTNANA
jgi:lysozyme family protein